MAHINRLANYDNKQDALDRHKTLSMEEIDDVLELIRTKQYPDGNFSDVECNVWSLVCRKLDIDY